MKLEIILWSNEGENEQVPTARLSRTLSCGSAWYGGGGGGGGSADDGDDEKCF